jgi:hypothetical protein
MVELMAGRALLLERASEKTFCLADREDNSLRANRGIIKLGEAL